MYCSFNPENYLYMLSGSVLSIRIFYFFMKTTIASGKAGEEKAVQFLLQKGWKILVQNYRYKRGEIDIIAINSGMMVFVEVKYRKNNAFGHPEDFVGTYKAEMLRKTATQYLVESNWGKEIRFDIVAITGSEAPEHFEDVF